MNIVGFKDFGQFCDELKLEADNIAAKIVRYEWNRRPEQNEQISFEVDFWATAVRMALPGESSEDERWLLEYGRIVGRDDPNAEIDGQAGTHAAESLHAKLKEICDGIGISLRPGRIEVF